MAVFVDLESDEEDSSSVPSKQPVKQASPPAQHGQVCPARAVPGDDVAQNADSRSFSACLTCYPVALSLSRHLDLNDLHSLSLTCRSLHDSLTQYAARLKSASLRCRFDGAPIIPELVEAYNLSDHSEGFREFCASQCPKNPGFKMSACARDLVAECRKCSATVCRNCAAKPPSNRVLPERHRRLCQVCLEAPLDDHLLLLEPAEELSELEPVSTAASSSGRSVRPVSDSPIPHPKEPFEEQAIKHADNPKPSPSVREPCVCAIRGVYLCEQCSHNIRSSDTTYKRVWTWRSRYSTHIGGGLGTGLGVGSQGQKCGRGEYCLDTSLNSISWVEIDCSEGSSSDHLPELGHLGISRSGTPSSERDSPSPALNKPGYLQQEVEGIGGVVKKKVKKKIKTGATVWEFDHERQTGKYLEREAIGKQRSWCSWCDRICLGERDRQQYSG